VEQRQVQSGAPAWTRQFAWMHRDSSTDWTWASPFSNRKAAAGSQGAHLCRKHQIGPMCRKKIAKNVEEMFAYRKVVEGRN
jgi:hypothetical protein